MLRRVFAGLVVVALVAGFAPAPKKKLKDTDPKALEGTWEVVITAATGKKGKKGPPSTVKRQVVIDKGTWTFQTPDGKLPTAKYKMTVDASKKPAWLDLERDTSGRKFKVIGIYEITGDTLKFRYVPGVSAAKDSKVGTPATRPTSFTGTGGATMTLKRVKK